MTQPILPNTNRANHSNLGKEFESALERTHVFYSVRKLAKIEKNPNEWCFSNQSKADVLARNGLHGNYAKTGNGRVIVRQKSDVDFSGVATTKDANVRFGIHVEFDAKQTKEKSFNFSYVERHQVQRLTEAEALGAIAGLMIMFSSLNRVFFVRASFLQQRIDDALFRKGRKSLALADLIENCVEVPVSNNLIDWHSVLCAK